MKKNVQVLLIFASLAMILFVTSCSKTATDSGSYIVPTVQTNNIIANVSSTTAQSGGVVTYSGDATVTANGVCWSSTSQTPTISDSKKVDSLVETTFISNITGLSPQTTYYLRAFATNSVGTGYGAVIKFTTLAAGASIPKALVTTFAGNLTAGFVNATGTAAQFNSPKGITVDAQGNLYIADSFNNSIRKITPAGVATTLAGSSTLGYVDATGANAQFYSPQGVVADANGNVYVADYGNNLIRKITAAGVVTTLAGSGTAGYADGTGAGSAFKSPRGMTVDGGGNLYVADMGNNLIRKITPAGVVTSIAGYTGGGYIDSTGAYTAFKNPSGIAIDVAGTNLYVTDYGNHSIRKIVIATGSVTTLAGSSVQSIAVNAPNGITIDANGNIYFVDTAGRIMELTAGKVLYTLAGSANVGFADALGTAALFNGPQTLTLYQGVLYVVDSGNNLIRKLVLQ